MNIEENPLKGCNFIKSLCKKISDIHNEALEHENKFPKCEICSENTNEFSFIKNQLFLIVRIHFQLKDEVENRSEHVEDSFEAGQYKVTKEETKDSSEDSSGFSTNAAVELERCTEENRITCLPKKDHKRCDGKGESGTPDTKNKFRSKSRAERRNLEKLQTTKEYQCVYCEKTFTHKCNLIMHMKSHRSNMEKRMKTPDKDETIGKQKCPFCHRIYKRKHECRLIEPKVPNIFSCTYCPETFSTYPKIYHHHKAHHPDKQKPLSPFQCDICGAFALRLYALKRHMLVHTDYAPFVCDICQKRFRTRQKLTEHQQKHIPKAERDDKYKCKVCEKKFAFRQSLKRHERLQHTNNRKLFPCTTCGGKFISETSLQKHQATHEGEAPRNHKCDQCGRIFEKLKYFNHHRKIRHNIFTDLMLNPKPKKKK